MKISKTTIVKNKKTFAKINKKASQLAQLIMVLFLTSFAHVSGNAESLMKNKWIEWTKEGTTVVVIKVSQKDKHLQSYTGKQEFESNPDSEGLYYLLTSPNSGIKNAVIKRNNETKKLSRFYHTHRNVSSPIYTYLEIEKGSTGIIVFTNDADVPLLAVDLKLYLSELKSLPLLWSKDCETIDFNVLPNHLWAR